MRTSFSRLSCTAAGAVRSGGTSWRPPNNRVCGVCKGRQWGGKMASNMVFYIRNFHLCQTTKTCFLVEQLYCKIKKQTRCRRKRFQQFFADLFSMPTFSSTFPDKLLIFKKFLKSRNSNPGLLLDLYYCVLKKYNDLW